MLAWQEFSPQIALYEHIVSGPTRLRNLTLQQLMDLSLHLMDRTGIADTSGSSRQTRVADKTPWLRPPVGRILDQPFGTPLNKFAAQITCGRATDSQGGIRIRCSGITFP